MAKYPGIKMNLIGNDAIGLLASRVCDLSGAYPITPSSGMSYIYAKAVADGIPNVWGRVPKYIEAQSEHGSASISEGMAMTGLRAANYTSSQGIKLMNEVLYSIAGKRLPCVFHIGTRALTTHALNIFDDNSDIMSVADTGWGMVFAKNVQEAADLGLIARRSAELSETPFFNVQSGFFTTATLESIQFPEDDMIREYLKEDRMPGKDGCLNGQLINFMHPKQKLMSGVVQGPQPYFDGMAAQRELLDGDFVLEQVRTTMAEFTKLTGREYKPVMTYKAEDAEHLIIMMNTHAADTAMATVDYMRSKGKKVGIVSIVVFTPFPTKELIEAIKPAKAITVLEKLDHRLCHDNPLTAVVKAALLDSGKTLPVYSCSAGLGGVEITPGQFIAITEHMEQGEKKKFYFVGANSPLAIDVKEEPDLLPEDAFTFVGGSLGGLGAVGMNKFIASLLQELSEGKVRAAARYGAEKMGLPTNVVTTISKEHIRVHCQPNNVQVYMAMLPAALEYPDMNRIRKGGTLIIESHLTEPKDILASIPESAQKLIREKKLAVIAVNATAISRENAPPGFRERMKGVVFSGALLHAYFHHSEGKDESWEQLEKRIVEALDHLWGRKGKKIVDANLVCVREGFNSCVQIPGGGD